MEKQCFKCHRTLSITEFYVHKKMGDGHLNKCKDCTRKDSLEHRANNLEKVMEYDRNRKNANERTEFNKIRQKELKASNPVLYKEITRLRLVRYRQKYKEKNIARSKVHYALCSGKLVNPLKCDICGNKGYSEAHHDDYSKPLEVRWLCDKCHKEVHKNIRRKARGNK